MTSADTLSPSLSTKKNNKKKTRAQTKNNATDKKTAPLPVEETPIFKESVKQPSPIPKHLTVRSAQNKQKPRNSKEPWMWLLAGGVFVIILIFWTISLPNTLDKAGGTNNGFFSQMGEKLGNTWKSIKTDILKIKDATDQLDDTNPTSNTSASEEQVRQLEENIFPQFEDPTKQ